MKVETLSVTRRICPVQYEYREVTVTGTIEAGETQESAAVKLVEFVEDMVHGTLGKHELLAQMNDSNSPLGKELMEATGNLVGEAAEEHKKKTTKKKVAKKVVKKAAAPKTFAYDRSSQAHKEEMAIVLDNNYPNWRSYKTSDKEFYAKVVAASTGLEGKPMFDTKMEVLTSFIDEVTNMIGEAPAADEL